MTFTPTTTSKVSTLNSTSATLGVSGEFLGTAEDVAKYSSIAITIKANVSSAALGLKAEFSTDSTNWDAVEAFTYSDTKSFFCKNVKVKAKYFRLRYTNGTSSQSTFRLQTRFIATPAEDVKDKPITTANIDAFARLRTSRPYTSISRSQILGKNLYSIYEGTSGSVTSTYNAASASVTMACTGSGSVIRRNRSRGIYQPGKSLLVILTGVLDLGTNASTVTTKIGYYDDDTGYYFQHVNGTVSVVERTSVSGSLVETVVGQSAWNVNKVDGTSNKNQTLDPTKAVIYWFNLEWLGVGFVDAGVVINGELIKVHRFTHSNLLTTPYMRTASLPPTYELVSTGGSGSMSQICYSVISEGGYRPTGPVFSANTGTTAVTINTIEPIITIRLKTGSIANVVPLSVSVVSTSASNTLIELYRFVDTAASSVLNNTTFISANAESEVEYNTAATTITTTGGLLLSSAYSSNNQDAISIGKQDDNGTLSISNGVSDLLVVAITTVGGNESFVASITWREVI